MAALTPLQPTASAGAAAAGQSHVCVAQHPPVTIPPVRAGKERPTGAEGCKDVVVRHPGPYPTLLSVTAFGI